MTDNKLSINEQTAARARFVLSAVLSMGVLACQADSSSLESEAGQSQDPAFYGQVQIAFVDRLDPNPQADFAGCDMSLPSIGFHLEYSHPGCAPINGDYRTHYQSDGRGVGVTDSLPYPCDYDVVTDDYDHKTTVPALAGWYRGYWQTHPRRKVSNVHINDSGFAVLSVSKADIPVAPGSRRGAVPVNVCSTHPAVTSKPVELPRITYQQALGGAPISAAPAVGTPSTQDNTCVAAPEADNRAGCFARCEVCRNCSCETGCRGAFGYSVGQQDNCGGWQGECRTNCESKFPQ